MHKSWLKSRIIWTAILTLLFSFLSLLGAIPIALAYIVDFGTMCLAIATIYFRFTTKVDVTMDPEKLRSIRGYQKMPKISLHNLDIVISNVEFCLDPENGPLDSDDMESILEYLGELKKLMADPGK